MLMPKPRHERLTADDIREIIDCYEYYKDCHAPMNFHDLAFVFDCSHQTIRRIFAGVHPALSKHQIVVEEQLTFHPRRAVGRPKGRKDKVPRKRKKDV